MKKSRCKLIFALDTSSKKKFISWIDRTKDMVDFYKVGLTAFTALGNESLKILHRRKKSIFLDLKFFDIPNTMINASLSAAGQGVDIIDFHLLAGGGNLRDTVSGIKAVVRKKKIKKPLFIGVTVLTSFSGKDRIHSLVLNLAERAKRSGLDGVVSSGREAFSIRRRFGKKFIIISPGIRVKAEGDDQKRVVRPRDVRKDADFIVVGRPIYTAKNPRQVVSSILEELKQGK